jgi:hypothetical protein
MLIIYLGGICRLQFDEEKPELYVIRSCDYEENPSTTDNQSRMIWNATADFVLQGRRQVIKRIRRT